ncbi:phosphoribosylamine--glycine ligase [Candidatus Pacebacteria bacterium]|nr:phosphoribosylamine--glycine ligase [Candidatus Paceibacterota bacterium]
MEKRILLVGNGAREHIIAQTLLNSSAYSVKLFVVGSAKNPGLTALATEYLLVDPTAREEIVSFAREQRIDFAIMGPEAPIAAGVVDALRVVGIASASPTQASGQLESSKSFTRNLLDNYNIPGNPNHKTFTTEAGLADFFGELGEDYVVKADGLKGGKGVKVSGDHLDSPAAGIAYARECLKEAGKVVIEEKLIGQEFSLMSFCDGTTTVDMPVVQDHKRAYEDDTGPNTGGMGSYSDSDHSLPFLTPADIEAASNITKQVAVALAKEIGEPFVGIMYGGFIATKNGVKLIEYNARFGDPEVMNVLSLLESDLVSIVEAMIAGTLTECAVTFARKATVCKYLVPNGYPDTPQKGESITINPIPEGVQLYYGSIQQTADSLQLCGSRAIAVVATAETIAVAEQLAEEATAAVTGPIFHRSDIGTAELINARVAHMNSLREK